MIDLLTVVFEKELQLLKIQAKSVDLYVDDIDTIFVIVNDDAKIAQNIDPSWWGKHFNKVRIIIADELEPKPNIPGWSSQQLYKILGSAQSNNEYVMVLDAKTWFIRKLEYNKIFTDKKINFHDCPIPGVFESAKNFVEDLYGIRLNSMIGPAGVPFLFNTRILTELIADIEQRTGKSFNKFFIESLLCPTDLTEFVLYSGFIINKYKSFDKVYSDRQYYNVSNICHSDIKNVDVILNKIKHPTVLTMSMHRNAYHQLTEQQLDTWYNLIVRFKLIPSPEIAKNLLNI